MSKATRRKTPARRSNNSTAVFASSPPKTPAKPGTKEGENAGKLPRGLLELLAALDEADDVTKELVELECDILLECRVCKSLYRNVENFSRHKQKYCTDKSEPRKPKKLPVKRAAELEATASPSSKHRRILGGKKEVRDKLQQELEEAMLDMGEGSEEDEGPQKDEEDPDDENGFEPPPPPKRVAKQRPWSTPQPERPLARFIASAATEPKPRRVAPTKAKPETPEPGINKCRHCSKIFQNKAGVVSHERYCAAVTMKSVFGKGLAFADNLTSDLPNLPTDDSQVSPKPAAGTKPGPKHIVQLPKGAVLRRSEGADGQTYIITTINGQQRAIPVRPAAAPVAGGSPGGTPGRTFFKVAVPAGTKPGQMVVMPAASKTTAPSTPKPAEPAKPATPETPKTPAAQPNAPQAPIPSYLQPDLVKLLKEFSNVSGTKYFALPELVALNGDPQSAQRLKELITALPPAGLIASKPISSGVLTKIVLSRTEEGETGVLKVVVIESGYASQMRLKNAEPSSTSSAAPTDEPFDDAPPAEEEAESGDVKGVMEKLFDENGPEEEEEEEDEESRLAKSKMLLPPPKPVLRKMNLKMNTLLQSAVSKQVKKKQQKDGEDGNGEEGIGIDASEVSEHQTAVQEKLKDKTESDVTFKEMFAMPEHAEEPASSTPEEYLAKAAIMLTDSSAGGGEEGADPAEDKTVRRSAFSRGK